MRSSSQSAGCFPTGLPSPGIKDLLSGVPQSVVGLVPEIAPTTDLQSLPLAVIDFETTGCSPAKEDRAVEVAIVHFDQGRVTARHSLLVNPGRSIPFGASRVHGIYDHHVIDKPKWDSIVRTILRLLVGRVPMAYNATFDRSFLFAEMRRVGISPESSPGLPPALRASVDWLDPLTWVRGLQNSPKGNKLGQVAERLGIPLACAHRAADDAEAAGYIFHELLRSRALSYQEALLAQRGYARSWRPTRRSV